MNSNSGNNDSKRKPSYTEQYDEINRRKQNENESSYNESVVNDKRKIKDDEINDLLDPLKEKWNSLRNYKTNFVFLVGNSGAGKSTFITSLLSHLKTIGLQDNLFSKEVLTDDHNRSGINYFSEKCILYERYQIFPERTDLRTFEYCSYKIQVDIENQKNTKCFLPTTFIELSGELIRSLHPSFDSRTANDLRDEMTNFLIDIAGRSNISVQVLFLSDFKRLETDWPIHDIFLSLFTHHQSIMKNLNKFLFHYVITKWDQVSHKWGATDSVDDIINREYKSIYNQMLLKTPGNNPTFYPFSVTDEKILDLSDEHIHIINEDLFKNGFSFSISKDGLYNSITTDFSKEKRIKFSTLYITEIGQSLLQNILDNDDSVIEIHEDNTETQQQSEKKGFGRWLSTFIYNSAKFLGINE